MPYVEAQNARSLPGHLCTIHYMKSNNVDPLQNAKTSFKLILPSFFYIYGGDETRRNLRNGMRCNTTRIVFPGTPRHLLFFLVCVSHVAYSQLHWATETFEISKTSERASGRTMRSIDRTQEGRVEQNGGQLSSQPVSEPTRFMQQ